MADFGAQLREARERKGISLRQIAASTKISVAALEGLERNDISKLPGGIFSRAFVRSYATEVGLDPDETVRQFLDRFAGEPTSPSPQAQPPSPAARAGVARRPQQPAARPIGRQGQSAPHDGRNGTEEADFESRQKIAKVVLKLTLVSLPIAAAILYFSARASSVTPRAAGQGRQEAADRLRAGSVVQETPSAPPATGERPAPEPRPAPPQRREVAAQPSTSSPAQETALRLEIAPSTPCWVNLIVDGELVVSRVIAAGERETREFHESAVLKVGDAAACAIAINGRAAKPLGPARRVREVRVTRDNYETFLP